MPAGLATPVDVATSGWSDWSTGVHVAVTDAVSLGAAERIVRKLMHDVEAAASRFRADSELSRLIANAGREVVVGDLLWDLITVALRAARLTDGLVDPTVGPALAALGYDRTITAVSDDEQRVPSMSGRRTTGWSAVRCDPQRHTVLLPLGGGLDLGATAKAWTADRAATMVADQLECGVLVSLGGDIAVAGPPPGCGWVVGIADDHGSEVLDAASVIVTSGGLATSSITTRTWMRGGQRLHHIIDPVTGLPTRGPWRTVSVAAATCVDANTASTAAIVRGGGASQWLQDNDLPARLVTRQGSVVTVAGWPKDAP